MIQRIDLTASPHQLFTHLSTEPGIALLETTRPNPLAFSLLACRPTEIIESDVPATPIGRGNPTDSIWTDPQSRMLPPFRSGWIGFLAYESASLWNRDLMTRDPSSELPLAWWARYEAVLAYRHCDGVWFLCGADSEKGRSAAESLRALAVHALARSASEPGGPARGTTSEGHLFDAIGPEEHGRSVGSILDWIRQGHIYQANLTYQMSTRTPGPPAGLYLRLRETNPAPFGAFLGVRPDLSILSSSPELFLQVRGRTVRTRPIKGTCPRDPDDPARDSRLARELLRSEKDRAELTMIVDLERNDLGRICEIGSVKTREFPELERYASVQHLAGTVEGRLDCETDLRRVLEATFPGGSVTGAPKIRAMEIIAQLETTPRFVYTGALGYLDDSGDLELALTIRTLWCHRDQVHLGVGGGIVADSHPRLEWEETGHKAEAMIRALESVDPRRPSKVGSARQP